MTPGLWLVWDVPDWCVGVHLLADDRRGWEWLDNVVLGVRPVDLLRTDVRRQYLTSPCYADQGGRALVAP